MNQTLIQVISAFLGSMGFALLFGLRRRYLFSASLGGMLDWAVYLAARSVPLSTFLSCLTAAAFAVLYAELLARKYKTPATLFVVPAIIPLVPGSSLFYAMDHAVHGDMAAAQTSGSETLLAALAIAAGISFVFALRELNTKRQAKQLS